MIARARQIDVGTISRIIGVVPIIPLLTDSTLFTASKDLEGVACIQINSGTAPYLRILTLTATKDVQSFTEHIHTLLTQDDT